MNALLLAGWIFCQGVMDGGTTYYALHSGLFHEANPIMRGPQLAVIKVSVNVGGFLFQKTVVEKKASGFTTKLLPIAFASTGCFAGILNLHTIHTH